MFSFDIFGNFKGYFLALRLISKDFLFYFWASISLLLAMLFYLTFFKSGLLWDTKLILWFYFSEELFFYFFLLGFFSF